MYQVTLWLLGVDPDENGEKRVKSSHFFTIVKLEKSTKNTFPCTEYFHFRFASPFGHMGHIDTSHTLEAFFSTLLTIQANRGK